MSNQLLGTQNVANVIPGAYEINLAMYTTLSVASALPLIFNCVSGNSAPVAASDSSLGTGKVHAFYSERLAASYTIDPADTLSLAASVLWTTANPNATIRCTLYRVPGPGVPYFEEQIGTVDGATAKDNVAGKDTYTFVHATAITVAKGERVLLRLWAIPPAGQTFTTGELRVRHGASTAGNDQATLNLPAGMTFVPHRTTLYTRRDASAVGGNFFQLATTRGASAATTGIVATANVSEKQWTRTSGGTNLEWISPRFADHFMFQSVGITNVNAVQFWTWPSESAISANAGLRVRLYRWRAGVETECFRADHNAELPTTAVSKILNDSGFNSSGQTNVVLTPCDFQADDRLVVRFFLIPVGGTMPSGQTATVAYDATGAGGSGDTLIQLYEAAGFKAEGDPAEPPTPPQAAMTGMGL